MSLDDRFRLLRCAPGRDKTAIEARYTRLSGSYDSAGKAADLRLPAERDRDRILYSTSFRRLGEITQVIPRECGHMLHNRLTHSLKVAQLGRRMAERLLSGTDGLKADDAVKLANELGGLDPNVVETAALAHDMGHPPFGHVIEEFLNEATKEETDGYEGNAQTFRIITFLEHRNADKEKQHGLDLTRASINATLKYPWAREVGPNAAGIRANKFGYYAHSQPDKEHFDTVRRSLSASCGGDGERSLEAELMDWADDIAYAIYDIDDFYRAGLIPLDKILREVFDLGVEAHKEPYHEMHYLFEETSQRWKSQRRESSEIDRLGDYFGIFCKFLQRISLSPKLLDATRDPTTRSIDSNTLSLRSAYRSSDEQRRALATLTSALVEEFASSIRLNPEAVDDRHKSKVIIHSESKTVVKLLKELTWTYVIDSPDLHVVQEGQRQIIETVFNKLFDAPRHDIKLIPRATREVYRDDLYNGPARRRHVSDMIASMTETAIAELYGRFTGVSPGTLLRATYLA